MGKRNINTNLKMLRSNNALTTLLTRQRFKYAYSSSLKFVIIGQDLQNHSLHRINLHLSTSEIALRNPSPKPQEPGKVVIYPSVTHITDYVSH